MQEKYRDKIRVICHSLKMTQLTGVDPYKLADLSSRVKALPSPEKISSLQHNDLIELSGRVEKLIFDIDNSKNSRTIDYSIKHRIDKGIPTRLTPLLAENSNWLKRATSYIDE